MGIRPFSTKMIPFVSAAVLVTGAAGLAAGQPGAFQGQQTDRQTGPDVSGAPPDAGTIQESGISDADAQSLADKDFLKKELEAGMAEVQFGQLAAQKASSEDVKSLGQKMVDDYTKLGNDLAQVAQGAGVKPPAGLSKKDKEMAAKLQQLSGPQFDDTYLEATVKNHTRDKDDVSLEAQRAAIPSVRHAAAQAEPVVSADLRAAQQVARTHNLK